MFSFGNTFSACPLNTFKSSEAQCAPCPRNSHTEREGQTQDGCMCDDGYTGPPGGPCEGETDWVAFSIPNVISRKLCIY